MNIDPTLGKVLGTVIALLAGAATKKMSKRAGSFEHEWAAPAIAAGSGIAYTLLTGEAATPEELMIDGGYTGAGAVLVQSVYKGLRDRAKRKKVQP